VVSKSASTVAVAVTLSGTTFPLIVKAQDGAPFADGDLIYIKTETLATYAIVNAGTASAGPTPPPITAARIPGVFLPDRRLLITDRVARDGCF